MTVGERVAQARRRLGREWTQARLTGELKKAGLSISRGWVANLETNRVRRLEPEEVSALARVLRVPSSYLMESAVGSGHDAGTAELLRDAPPGVDMGSLTQLESTAPVLGVVSADRFSFSFDAAAEDYVPNPWPRKKVFALRISGDCMEPTFHDGEFVYLSETQQVLDGKVVLAQLDGEFTLKRYFRRADGVELKPDNPKYKSIKVASNKLVIRGVVVGTYRRDI